MTTQERYDLAMKAFQDGVYAKNITYGFSPKADLEEFEYVRRLGGSPGQSAWMTQQMYHRVGIQYQVQKEVSDEMMETDFSEGSRLEDIPWPAPAIEMYFEDPKLPTILLMKTSPQYIESTIPGITVALKEPEYLTALMQEGTDPVHHAALSLQLHPGMYKQFLDTAETEKMDDMGAFNSSLNERDHASISYMLNLAIKVLVFASLPRFKPAPIGRKQMHFGGKPDVRGRPQRPAFRTFYAPNVRYLSNGTDKKPGESGIKREFRGRRGYWVYYKHERYTLRRGTWDYIPRTEVSSEKIPTVVKVRKA